MVERHIADSEPRAAEQRVRISLLRNRGLDTREAEWLLAEFEEILQEMLYHR